MSDGNLLCSKPCQEVELKKCSMDSVVVYKDRAEVKRNVTINIPAGASEVIIKGLSESIDGDSIRCVIIYVEYSAYYYHQTNYTDNYKELALSCCIFTL